MDLAEAAKLLDPWIKHARTRTFQGRPWPSNSLAGSFSSVEINWFVNEQDLPAGRAITRWPYVEGRLKPRISEALAVWTLYHGGPGMLEE